MKTNSFKSGLIAVGVYTLANVLALSVIGWLKSTMNLGENFYNWISLSSGVFGMVISFMGGFYFNQLLSNKITEYKTTHQEWHDKYVREICKIKLLKRYGCIASCIGFILVVLMSRIKDQYPVTFIMIKVWTLLSVLFYHAYTFRNKKLRRLQIQNLYDDVIAQVEK
ncbi:MAG: hypothetical protein HDR88_11805 [Bacteroides sp.]|nr:hypothetical protein [Bacteroides sp.]